MDNAESELNEALENHRKNIKQAATSVLPRLSDERTVTVAFELSAIEAVALAEAISLGVRQYQSARHNVAMTEIGQTLSDLMKGDLQSAKEMDEQTLLVLKAMERHMEALERIGVQLRSSAEVQAPGLIPYEVEWRDGE
jgi:uncharacterized protein YukE